MNLEGTGADKAKFERGAMRLEDRWILSRLEQTRRAVNAELEAFHFQGAISVLYKFFWDELCDWYLEAIKPRLAAEAERTVPQRVLAFVLDRSLRLLHPFIPFITEAAWEGLNATVRERGLPGLAESPPSDRLIAASWPEATDSLIDEQAEREFGLRRDILLGVRLPKAESGQSASQVTVYVPDPGPYRDLIASTFTDYGSLAGVREFHVGEEPPTGQTCASSYVETSDVTVYVPMPEEMVVQERARVAREMEAKKRLLASIEAKLSNPQFTDRAPPEVVERERARAEEARTALAALEKRLASFG